MISDRQGVHDLASLALTPADGVVAVDLSDGALLVDEGRSRALPLNRSGALLWDCFDGESSVGEICADLADGFGVAPERAAADVEPLTRRLLDLRFVTAPGFDTDADELFASPCCPPGRFERSPGQGDHVHQLVHDGVWLEESADSCRDARYLLGAQGEVVAQITADDGSRRLIGIRTNDLGVAAEVRTRLGGLLAEDEPFGYPNISILMGDRRGPVRDVNIVVRRGVRAFHTFSKEEAIDAAMCFVSTFAQPAAGLLQLQARPLVKDGRVVVVADAFIEALDAERRQLERAGFGFLPILPVTVDPVAGEAVLPGSPAAPVERSTVRLPIADLVVAGAAPGPGDLTSFDLARLTPLVSGGQRPLVAREVADLAKFTARVPLVWVPAADRRGLADALLSL